MKVSMGFIRIFFVLLSILCMTTFALSANHAEFSLVRLATGILGGCIFGFFLIGAELVFQRFKLKSLNILILGLFLGYLFGQALTLIINYVIGLGPFPLTIEMVTILRLTTFIFGVYIGVVMTLHSSEELHISFPYIKFNQQKVSSSNEIILASSSLMDPRIIDLASSGILDDHLIVPRFVIKELQSRCENGDESSKAKARRSLEIYRKLKESQSINVRTDNTEFPEIKAEIDSLVKLARLSDARIMTSDMNRIQMSTIEGIKIININTLSNALKPLMQSGEFITIKIQRYGKEARQGVGYLEDGTMVVVNGGGDHIGEAIRAQVLSVKHTSSGRMIFCNSVEQDEYPHPPMNTMATATQSYQT